MPSNEERAKGMNKAVEKLCAKCKEAIESAARESYNDGTNPDEFGGCCALVGLKGKDQIEVSCDRHGAHEVAIYKEDMNELPNIEKAITDYLDANTDEQGEWQDEYDNDDWRDVDPGCDPAFPHYGDFERWAYGR